MRRGIFSAKNISQVITGHSIAIFALVALGTYTLTTQGPTVLSVLASSASSVAGSPATLYFRPYSDQTIPIGDTADIDLSIDMQAPINVVGATITFPPDSIQIVGISKKNSFLELWTEDTVIKEDLGEVHFSGGTPRDGGQRTSATVLTLSIKAKKSGTAVIGLRDVEVFGSDGTGKPLRTDTHDISYEIIEPPAARSTAAAETTSTAPLPNPDLNGDGRVGVADMSILVVKLLVTYDPRYDLNGDGHVNLGDLSVVFARM